MLIAKIQKKIFFLT